MSSPPPLGGTTRRSVLAILGAPIVSFPHRLFADQICPDSRRAEYGRNLRGKRWSRSQSVDLECRQASQIKFGNSALIAGWIRAAT
jgi:hypothetical protein